MFGKSGQEGHDRLDGEPKLYQGLWTLSLVLAEIAREEGEKKGGHNMSCPRHKCDGQGKP